MRMVEGLDKRKEEKDLEGTSQQRRAASMRAQKKRSCLWEENSRVEGGREGGRHEDFSVAVVAVVSNCSARVSQKH